MLDALATTPAGPAMEQSFLDEYLLRRYGGFEVVPHE